MQGWNRSEKGMWGWDPGRAPPGMGHQRVQTPDSAIVVRYMVKAVPVRLLFQCANGIATGEGVLRGFASVLDSPCSSSL